MKEIQQQPREVLRGELIELTAITSLVFFGLVMLFLGWLKYRDRKRPGQKKPGTRSIRKGKRK